MVTKITAAKLGKITENFLLNDMNVWIQNTSATGGYVSTDFALLGFTGQEKSINFINEKYEREDNIPRTVTYSKTIRKGLEISTDLSNFNEEFIPIVRQATTSSLGSGTGTRIAHGTDEATLQYRAIRFTAQRDDGKTYVIDVPKCQIIQNGEQTIGGESETVMPLMFKAIVNNQTGIAATANLFVEMLLESGVNATAIPPDGYN